MGYRIVTEYGRRVLIVRSSAQRTAQGVVAAVLGKIRIGGKNVKDPLAFKLLSGTTDGSNERLVDSDKCWICRRTE